MVRKFRKEPPAADAKPEPPMPSRDQNLAAAVAVFKKLPIVDRRLFKRLSNSDEELILHAVTIASKDVD
jgi:hypothetical protein